MPVPMPMTVAIHVVLTDGMNMPSPPVLHDARTRLRVVLSQLILSIEPECLHVERDDDQDSMMGFNIRPGASTLRMVDDAGDTAPAYRRHARV